MHLEQNNGACACGNDSRHKSKHVNLPSVLQDLPDGNFRDVKREGKKVEAKGETLKAIWAAARYSPSPYCPRTLGESLPLQSELVL